METRTLYTLRLWVILTISVVGFLLLIDALRPILLPFILGGIIAYLFDPLADRLERAGLSRTAATVLIIVSFFALMTALVLSVGPMLVQQFADLLRTLPAIFGKAQILISTYSAQLFTSLRETSPVPLPEDVSGLFAGFSARAVQTVLNVLEGVAASSGAVFNLLSMLMITPIVAFYFIRDWDHMVARVHTYIPRRFVPTVQAQFSAIDSTLAAYLRGQIEVMCVLAVYYAIALSIIGVPYALILALLSGLFIIIPYLGTLLSTGLAVGVAYLHFPELSPVWWTLGVYLAGQILESQILTPKLIGQSVGLHPLWVIFGLLAGGALLGFVGVLLALPITAVIGVVVGFWMQRYQQSSYYHAAPSAPPPTDAA